MLIKKNILLLTTFFLATKLHSSTAINTSIQKESPEVTHSRRDLEAAMDSERLARRKKKQLAQTTAVVIITIVGLTIIGGYILWERISSGRDFIKPGTTHICIKQGQNQIHIEKDKICNHDSLSETTPAEKSNCTVCLENWLCDKNNPTTYEEDEGSKPITQTTRIRICKCRDSFNICLNCWDNWFEEGKETCPQCRGSIQKSELNKARKLLEVVKILQKLLKKEKLSLQEVYSLRSIKKSEIIS